MACITCTTQVMRSPVNATCVTKTANIAATGSIVCSVETYNYTILKTKELLRLQTSDGYILVTPLNDND